MRRWYYVFVKGQTAPQVPLNILLCFVFSKETPPPPLVLCAEAQICSHSMAENQNPFQVVLQTYEKFAKCIQTHLSPLFPISSSPSSSTTALESHQMLAQYNIVDNIPKKPNSATPVTKEELGRATWTLLHTLAAQFPDRPTRQQKKDVKELMAILSRLYPCKECADHFKEVLSVNPVQAGSQAEFSQWLCHVHNVVNRSLGKLVFPCQRVDARWGKLDCPERACDLEGSTKTFGQ